MKSAKIEDLAYLIKEAKDKNQEKPIVFLGAGASKSGGIPLASEIVEDILEKFKDKPAIKRYVDGGGEQEYAKLMDLLAPQERNSLLKGYIDEAKINVTHIYLAQMISEGLVDYVLTVNFDNLMLRALALYNEFLPTYDMAILKDPTTSTFKTKSIVYLHGQSHGLWLLNTAEELAKGNEVIPPVLHTIKNNRPWIIIGYGGDDPIFDHIAKLGRFDNGLYWIGYKDKEPNEKVRKELLEKENTNSSLIQGHDSDSFMIELCRQLGLAQPKIFEKPFSALGEYLENIVDIDDEEHFKTIKERLSISKEQVQSAINEYEKGEISELKEKIFEQLLEKEIISETLKPDYDENKLYALEQKTIKTNNQKIKKALSGLFFRLGNMFFAMAKDNKSAAYYKQAIEKFKKAIEFRPDDGLLYYNLSHALINLAEIENRDIQLITEVIENCKKALSIKPYDTASVGFAYYIWGIALLRLAVYKNTDKEILLDSIEKFRAATSIIPKNGFAFFNWGAALNNLAIISDNKTVYYKEAIEKYKKASELISRDSDLFYSWGNALFGLAKENNNDMGELREAIEKLETSKQLNGQVYSLACAYALIGEKDKALENLKIALQKNKIEKRFVFNKSDFAALKNNNDFVRLLEEFGENQ